MSSKKRRKCVTHANFYDEFDRKILCSHQGCQRRAWYLNSWADYPRGKRAEGFEMDQYLCQPHALESLYLDFNYDVKKIVAMLKEIDRAWNS